ncbi:MAG: hypothetical protein ACE5IY_23430 [bacterium]
MIEISDLIEAYETDVNDPKGLGRFEVLNMLTNRDVLEEHRSELTTLQSTRLLIADEKLLSNRDPVIAECGGKTEFAKLRQHNPVQSAWWWFLEQIPLEELVQ